MNQFPNPSLGRRALLRNGGLALSLGAIAAACGTDRGGSTDPGRLGVADEAPEVEQGVIDDVVLLRTAQSLEHTLLAVYAAVEKAGGLGSAGSALAARFVEDHTAHAAAIGALIKAAGGEEFACANPFIVDRSVDPIFAAIDGSDDTERDLFNISHAFEDLAAATFQALTTALSDPALRSELMRIGSEENRHASALAKVINPGVVFSPAMSGEPLENDSDGFPRVYAIPSTFGQLTGINLVVGARDVEGARFATQLQTPAENTYVYADQSC